METVIKICFQVRGSGITNIISTNATQKVSSIVYEVIKTILGMFIYLFIYLFYKKISKETIFTLSKDFMRGKQLLPLWFSVCLILFCWLVFACDLFLSA